MVKLRLTHYGRKNTPFFRIVAVDSKTKRDGGYLELLGTFNPTPAASKQNQPRVSLNKEAIVKWLKVGAQPSETVLNFLKDQGIWKEIIASTKVSDAPEKKSKRKLSAKKVAKKLRIKKEGKAKKVVAPDVKVSADIPAAAPAPKPVIQNIPEPSIISPNAITDEELVVPPEILAQQKIIDEQDNQPIVDMPIEDETEKKSLGEKIKDIGEAIIGVFHHEKQPEAAADETKQATDPVVDTPSEPSDNSQQQ